MDCVVVFDSVLLVKVTELFIGMVFIGGSGVYG